MFIESGPRYRHHSAQRVCECESGCRWTLRRALERDELIRPEDIPTCDLAMRLGVFHVVAKCAGFRGCRARGSGDQGGLIVILRLTARKLESIWALARIDSGPIAAAWCRHAESPAAPDQGIRRTCRVSRASRCPEALPESVSPGRAASTTRTAESRVVVTGNSIVPTAAHPFILHNRDSAGTSRQSSASTLKKSARADQGDRLVVMPGHLTIYPNSLNYRQFFQIRAVPSSCQARCPRARRRIRWDGRLARSADRRTGQLAACAVHSHCRRNFPAPIR